MNNLVTIVLLAMQILSLNADWVTDISYIAFTPIVEKTLITTLLIISLFPGIIISCLVQFTASREERRNVGIYAFFGGVYIKKI